MELIDKNKVLDEIQRMVQSISKNDVNGELASIHGGQQYVLMKIFRFVDNLEAKEVDLDESARHYLLHEHTSPLNEVLHQADLKVEMQYHKDIEDAYKAGFELGLKAKVE